MEHLNEIFSTEQISSIIEKLISGTSEIKLYIFSFITDSVLPLYVL